MAVLAELRTGIVLFPQMYKRVAEEDSERDNRLSDDITVQMSSHRLDIACYRLPPAQHGTSSSYYDTTQVREILMMRRRFDEQAAWGLTSFLSEKNSD